MKNKHEIKSLIEKCRATRRAFNEDMDVANFNACVAAYNALEAALNKAGVAWSI